MRAKRPDKRVNKQSQSWKWSCCDVFAALVNSQQWTGLANAEDWWLFMNSWLCTLHIY